MALDLSMWKLMLIGLASKTQPWLACLLAQQTSPANYTCAWAQSLFCNHVQGPINLTLLDVVYH